MNKRIVAKFGGTSMADASAIEQSASVARDNKAAVVVVSAVSGMTEKLIKLAKYSVDESWDLAEELINEIAEQHIQIAEELEASGAVIRVQEDLLRKLEAHSRKMSHVPAVTDEDLDEMVSFGELLSSNLMVVAMNEFDGNTAELLDAREVVVTDSQFGTADPDVKKTIKNGDRLVPELASKVFVTQGFIGRDSKGKTTTLGRGGSDYSAAVFAEAFNAAELQIWTDVPGIATTDPRLTPKARPIATMSFQEAAELATSGAKVLHPTTIMPARRASIPVFVGSTFEPEAGGTTIDAAAHSRPLVRAITIKKDQHFITLNTPKMSQQYGFLAKVFQVIAGHNVSIDQVTTSEVAVAMTVDDTTMLHKEMFKELSELGEVEEEDGLSVVTLIGNRVNHTPGLTKRIFDCLQSGDQQMSVRAIFQGASKHSVGIMISANHGKAAVERLHKEFLEGDE